MCGLRRCIATRRYVEPTSLLLDKFSPTLSDFSVTLSKRVTFLCCFDKPKGLSKRKRSSEGLLQRANSCELTHEKAPPKRVPIVQIDTQSDCPLLSDYFISPYNNMLKALTIDFGLVFCSFLFLSRSYIFINQISI